MAGVETVREMLERLGLGHNVGGAGGWVSVSPDAVAEVEAYVDARLGQAGQKADAYDLIHDGGYLQRAHSIASNLGGRVGRNVWHVLVEIAEDHEAQIHEVANVARRDGQREGRVAGRHEALADLARWFREDAAQRADPTSVPLAVVLRRLGVEP